MSGHLLADVNLMDVLRSPVTWGLLLCGLGLYVAFAAAGRGPRRLGQLCGGVGLILLAVALPKLSPLARWQDWVEQIVFWVLAGSAVVCSAAAVTARNPVYTAIWFAASLIGVAGLFLFQNAQFLGVATIVVYAGAIVVTFLFVLMLANPEGEAQYDRISWAKFPAPVMILVAAALLGLGSLSFAASIPSAKAVSRPAVAEAEHVAHFGGELFAKHMISVEVAGTILLVALVGAVAIVIQGKDRRAKRALPTDRNLERLP